MKKIHVVLLILAVAGGVFAQQGTWSLSADVEIGTRLNFDPDPEQDGDDDKAIVAGIAYNDWDALRGNLSIGYARGNAFVGLLINTNHETRFTTTFEGDAFRAKFQFNNFMSILRGQVWGSTEPAALYGQGGPIPDLHRMWGEYKFFDGMVALEAAFRSDELEFWTSDKTAAYGERQTEYYDMWYNRPIYDDAYTFTYVDRSNYLRAGADVNALSFGIILPNLFSFADYWAPWGIEQGITDIELVEDVIKQAVLGVKFDQSPLEFAAQFALQTYGVYFGGKFTTGPIAVGISFMGDLDGDTIAEGQDADPLHMRFGGRFEYNGDGFGGGIKAFYDMDEVPYKQDDPGSEWYLTTIGIEPFLFYDAIPSHLRFALDIGFYFFNETNGNDSTKTTVWSLQPQLFWNFLGTGAGSYWSYNTGIMIRYRMANADFRDYTQQVVNANNSVNFLDVVFKWGL